MFILCLHNAYITQYAYVIQSEQPVNANKKWKKKKTQLNLNPDQDVDLAGIYVGEGAFDFVPPPGLPLIFCPATRRTALQNLLFSAPQSNKTVYHRFEWCKIVL